MIANKVAEAIDQAMRKKVENDPPRSHLGASLIGSRCLRQVWYSFRWAYQVKHLGRILRLFERGQLEEDRFAAYFRRAGYEVQDYRQRLIMYDGVEGLEFRCIDWDEPIPAYFMDVSDQPALIKWAIDVYELPLKQWGFEDHEGHFAGNADGKIRGPHLPPGWGLIEEKTHSEKSFTDLKKKGIVSSKLVHWVQMQIYMNYLGLEWGLYCAVNKNTDELYFEIVHSRPDIADKYREVALQIIQSRQAPKRISEDKSWFECKFCDFREICHYQESPLKNCRSCQYAEAVADKGWRCNKYAMLIPKDFIPKGCEEWVGIN